MLNKFLVIWCPFLWLVVFSQLRSSTETNKRSVEGLETKLVKMKAELESSKLAHEATRAEFESYKVRLCLSMYIFVAKSLQLYVVRNLENGKGLNSLPRKRSSVFVTRSYTTDCVTNP